MQEHRDEAVIGRGKMATLRSEAASLQALPARVSNLGDFDFNGTHFEGFVRCAITRWSRAPTPQNIHDFFLDKTTLRFQAA